jgi:uncharacterized membrane protein YcaP (DUF421 family)
MDREVIDRWLGASGTELWVAAVSTMAIFAVVIVATRITGLRSFSKMSAFDFAMTVAVGSLIATVSITQASLLTGVVGVAVLYGIQLAVATLRRSETFSRVVDNQPTLLMVDGELIPENLRAARVTEDDLMAKLREANVLRFEQVRAVVLETTGDVTVLHGEGPVDAGVLRNVQGAERLTGR